MDGDDMCVYSRNLLSRLNSLATNFQQSTPNNSTNSNQSINPATILLLVIMIIFGITMLRSKKTNSKNTSKLQ